MRGPVPCCACDRNGWRRRRVTRAGVLVLWLLGGAGCVAAAAATDGRVLVMPFERATRDPQLLWLTEAAAVLLGEDLRALGRETIGRDDRLRAFDELQLPPRASLSHATVIRVGELVGAAEVVIGSLALDGDHLIVRARAIRIDAGLMRPEVVERGPLTDLFVTFDRVAGELGSGVRAAEGHSAGSHAPLAAFESYVKGLVGEAPASQVKFLETALKLHPGYDEARVALWQVFTGLGEHTRAFAAISAVAAASPMQRRARFLGALSDLRLKRNDAAFSAWRGLADAAPSASVANNLGVVQLRRGRPAGTGVASLYFGQAVAAEPGDPDYAFNLGYAYWFERKPQEAVDWLREAVRRSPADGDAHFVLGTVLRAGGASVEGTRELELARQLSSSYAEWERRPEAATEPVPRGLERVRDDLDRPAFSLIETMVAPAEQRDQREIAAFHLARGTRLYDAQQDHEAIMELRRSLYVSPYQAPAHLLLGRIYLRANRLREAIGALKLSIWCEETAAAHVVLGEVYFRAKETAQARAEAERALVLDPRSTGAKALLEKLPAGQADAPGNAL
jgi:tetratricopeptide (TPR) repeat protein